MTNSSLKSRFEFGPALPSRILAACGVLTWVLCKYLLDRNPSTAHLSFAVKMTLGMVSGLPFGLLAVWFDRSRSRKNQLCRDLKAAQTFDDVLAGHVSRFSLYLRPFYTTSQLETDHERFEGISGHIARAGTDDFETQLAQLLPPDEPLVALGRPGEAIGAGRIETDDETWTNKLELLAKNAAWIYLVPLERPGTIWEVKYILSNGLLHKTTFVMPPSKSIDLKNRWSMAQNSCRELGIRLPEYQDDGIMFFRVSNDGISYAHTNDLNVARAAQLPKQVRLQVKDDPKIASCCPECGSKKYVRLTPEKMIGEATELVECKRCHTQYIPKTPLGIGLVYLVAGPILGSLLFYGFRTAEWKDLLSLPVAFVFLVGAVLTIVLPLVGGSVVVDWLLSRKSEISKPTESEQSK